MTGYAFLYGHIHFWNGSWVSINDVCDDCFGDVLWCEPHIWSYLHVPLSGGGWVLARGNAGNAHPDDCFFCLKKAARQAGEEAASRVAQVV